MRLVSGSIPGPDLCERNAFESTKSAVIDITRVCPLTTKNKVFTHQASLLL